MREILMRWYRRASKASIDMSVPRKMVEDMVSRMVPLMEEQALLSRTPLDVDEYARRADQAMAGMEEGLRASLAPMVSSAIGGVRSGNREPLSDLVDNMMSGNLGGLRKRWGEVRELWKVMTTLDDHMSSSEGVEVSAKQMAEEYRKGLESDLSRGEQQALELASKIEGFLAGVGSSASVVLEMSPGENYETKSPVFYPMDFNLIMTFPGSEALEPSMTVFTDGDKGMDVDDVLSWGDGDFFSNDREMGDYFGLVEFLRTGKMPEQKKGFVKLYRGMSPDEYGAWQSGAAIPAGKYFSSSPTTEYAQDISGEFPELFLFLVDRGIVYETSPGEYQTSGDARLEGKKIVPA